MIYSPKQCADSHSFSPSAMKPKHVMTMWEAAGFPIEVIETEPLEITAIMRAHEPSYVLDVLACIARNGFGNRLREVADSLQYTTGSMVQAMRAAMANKIGAVSPTSGFHHAGYAHGGGFCTFNGLMVAALSLGFNCKVGILDCDQHYGDGTDDIIRELNVTNVIHHSQGSFRNASARKFLSALPDVLERFKGCDVVLYQAGADCHIDDPLGGWLTTGQIMERDRIAFQCFRDWGVPVAWNLAGGYQEDFSKVLKIHYNTMQVFTDAFFKQEI